MATVTKPGRTAAQYIPTLEQIAAACDEIHLQRLADFDAGIIPRDGFHQNRKSKKSKKGEESEGCSESVAAAIGRIGTARLRPQDHLREGPGP